MISVMGTANEASQNRIAFDWIGWNRVESRIENRPESVRSPHPNELWHFPRKWPTSNMDSSGIYIKFEKQSHKWQSQVHRLYT